LLRNRPYLAIVSGHFVIDMFTGASGVLLAVLSVPLGLTNTQMGTAIMLYMFAGALSQPFFGWFADRTRLHPLLLASVSIAWMAVFFALVVATPVWWLIVLLLLLAALGSGLFHPIGTSEAPLAREGSANTSTAVFFLGGQMGLAFGPVIGGLLFSLIGVAGILPLSALALVPALLLWLTSRGRAAEATAAPATLSPGTPDSEDWGEILRGLLSMVVLAFVLLVAVRSSMQATFQFLLPKLFEDRGWLPAVYGTLTGTFMATAALGNVAIGKLADHFGMRLVAAGSLLLSVPVSILMVTTTVVPLTFAACALSGMLVGGQHSILVVHAQRLLPVRKGLAAGLILGFTFATGAVGTWLVGFAGDNYTLLLAMEVMALMGIPAALLALTLPGRETAAVLPAPQTATRSS
jgi:FSR family fosmidomycin resistance protein-like MFS transporter